MSHLGLVFEFPGSLSTSTTATVIIDRAYHVGIGGRGFLLTGFGTNLGIQSRHYLRASAQALKPQFDSSKEPAERSLGDVWWRRSQSDFSGGAGQIWLDRDTSDPTRFLSSKGIDIFSSAPEARLQKNTQQARASSSTNLYCLQAGDTTSYVYVADDKQVYYSTNPFAGTPTWTSSTIWVAETAETVNSITSSGQHVYAIGSANGIHRTVLGAGTSSHYSDLNGYLIRWAKQRLMAAAGSSIYEIVATGAAPAAAFTHANTNWLWVDFADIGPAILAAGYSGEKSTIYGATVQADGTLGVWHEVTEGGLPDGEIIRALASYLGFVFIGTNKGVRVATHDAEGNLTYGPLVPVDTTVDVRSFEAQDVYMWFGWTNYDGSSTGLGRLDLRTFTATLRPAYASDLMVTAQGNVLAVCTHTSKRFFAVSASGFYAEATTYVSAAVLTTSKMGYGTTIEKIAKILEVNMQANSGTVTPSIADANDSYTSLTPVTGDFAEITTQSKRSPALSLKFDVVPVGGGASSPILRYFVLRALPALRKERQFSLPIRLFDKMLNNGIEVSAPGKALSDLDFLENLENDGNTVVFEDISSGIGGQTRSFEVVIQNIEFRVLKVPEKATGFGGVAIVVLQTV